MAELYSARSSAFSHHIPPTGSRGPVRHLSYSHRGLYDVQYHEESIFFFPALSAASGSGASRPPAARARSHVPPEPPGSGRAAPAAAPPRRWSAASPERQQHPKRKGPRPTAVEKEVERHDLGGGGLRGSGGERHDGRDCEQQAQRVARQQGSAESTLPLTLRGGKRMSTFGFELRQPNDAENWQHG